MVAQKKRLWIYLSFCIGQVHVYYCKKSKQNWQVNVLNFEIEVLEYDGTIYTGWSKKGDTITNPYKIQLPWDINACYMSSESTTLVIFSGTISSCSAVFCVNYEDLYKKKIRILSISHWEPNMHNGGITTFTLYDNKNEIIDFQCLKHIGILWQYSIFIWCTRTIFVHLYA